MRVSVTSFAVILTVSIAVGGMALLQGVRAQNYPPPVGSLSVEAAATTTGSTTTVTATVLDNSGDPVDGADVTFTITSQPGDDAAWANGSLETTVSTNAQGVAAAALTAGSTAGTIIVETVSGEKTSQVTVAVTGAQLPTTGAAPAESSGGGVPPWQIAFIAIGAAVAAGGILVMVRRNRRA